MKKILISCALIAFMITQANAQAPAAVGTEKAPVQVAQPATANEKPAPPVTQTTEKSAVPVQSANPLAPAATPATPAPAATEKNAAPAQVAEPLTPGGKPASARPGPAPAGKETPATMKNGKPVEQKAADGKQIKADEPKTATPSDGNKK